MNADRLAELGPALQRLVDERGFAGIAAAVVHRGRLVHASWHGSRDAAAGLPLGPDTIYRIYSMTKPVVATAIMTLVERGELRLSDQVARYLPSFGSVRVLTADGAASVPQPAMTVWHLLTHTSGLGNELSADPLGAAYRSVGLHADATRSLAEFVDTVATLPLGFAPGSRWQYSVGIDVAARIAEIATGQPFDALLQDRVFGPLGMVDTAYWLRVDQRHRLASIHGVVDVFKAGLTGAAVARGVRDGHNDPIDVEGTHPSDSPGRFVRGGYGLYSTLRDFLRFSQMLANGGALDDARILRPDTVAQMTTNQLPAALLPFDVGGRRQHGFGFGFGSQVLLDVERIGGLGSPGEHGWPGAAGTTYWVDPVEGIVGLLMTQYLFGPDDASRLLHRTVYEALGSR